MCSLWLIITVKWTWLCRMIPDSCVDWTIIEFIQRSFERYRGAYQYYFVWFLFSFSFGFLLVCQFSFFFNEMSLSSLYEAFRCTIFCHFFLMWKVQFLNIKNIYICLVFFNYISYMAISKGQIIKSRQWSEIMSRVRNEEKPQRCWFNWSNV